MKNGSGLSSLLAITQKMKDSVTAKKQSWVKKSEIV